MSLKPWRRYSLPCCAGLVAVVSGGSCASDDVARVDVVGRYALNNAAQRDEIVLRPDGTYLHTVDGDPALVDSNAWTLEHVGTQTDVSLTRFHAVGSADPADWIPGSKSSVVYDSYNLMVERSVFGAVRLVVNSDINIAYEKQ